MKGIRYRFEKLMSPFVSIAVLIDESKRINEDGAWDSYNRRRNEKEMKKNVQNR